MFKIYDLNMKELPFPEGVKPLDIFVSSVNKRRLTEEFEGRSGALNYGYDYGERSVDLSLWLEAHDTMDYRLIRNELYAFFDTHDVFYIEETRVPSRVLKVAIDESYIPERINQTHSSVEISCRTLDSVFWESKYTTLDLHDTGYSATAEKYGLVDNIDDEKVKYRFTPDLIHTDFTSDLFENGSIFLSNGENADSNSQPGRLENHYSIIKGQNYRLNLSETGGTVNYIRIFHYDALGNHISNEGTGNVGGNGSTSYDFVAIGDSIRFLLYAVGGEQVNINGIGTLTKISLSSFASTSEFNVYNAGNVTVEPESMLLKIDFRHASSEGNLALKNLTTGEVFEFYKTINRRNLTIDGMNFKEDSINAFRDTNRRFISLVPGNNDFELTGVQHEGVWFDFKFYYK